MERATKEENTNVTSVLILTTYWADDYWYKNGEAPYTKNLDDLLDFIGDQNFRAIGIYGSGKQKGKNVDMTNLPPAFLKVTRIDGNKDEVKIQYEYHEDKLEMPSKLLLEGIQKLTKYKTQRSSPLCFFLTDKEWTQVVESLKIAPRIPSWWMDVEHMGEPKNQLQEFTVERFRSKFEIGAYRTKHGLKVRSRMEVIISDFLMDNGIVVQYEPLLLLNDSKLYPDFYIPSLDIYIEYWGSNEENYMRKRQQKEALYQKHGVRYISLDESDAAIIYDRLKQELSPYLPGKTDWR